MIRAGAGQEQSKQFELPNGLKVFLLEKRDVPLLNVVAAVNLGSKDETEETNGLVHLLEHYILFRGTEKRTGKEISREIREQGAYFNAHTGQDMVIFEISLPAANADFALNNQKELLFSLKLTQRELDTEKEVVLEELNHVKDDPIKFATALVHENLFPGHPYSRPIFGKKEVISAVSVDEIENFYRKYFVPPNCSLAVVGDFSLKEMEEKIVKVFGDIKKVEGFTSAAFEKAPPLVRGVDIEKEMDVQRAYVVIGLVGPDYNHPDQYALDVLTEILGRGVNPLLNSVLRGGRDLVQTVSMSFSSMKYGGAMLIYLTLDPKNISSAKRVAIDFLRKARNMNFSKEDFLGEQQLDAYDYLESAKNRIKFNSQQFQEKGLSLATSLATHLILSDNTSRGSYLEHISPINSSDVRKTAAKYLSREEYVTVSIIPKKKK